MKTNQDYNEMLSLVTHDLKSPLTAVIGGLELLAYDGLTKDEKKKTIKQAQKASNQYSI